jgi:hypothetical protein
MLDNPYVQNVVSEFIALLLIALIGLAIYHITGRRRLLKFFNISRSKNLCLYLSNLSIPSGGSVGVDGVPRSYAGPAIPLYEVHLVPVFQRFFNLLIPGIESMPGFLKSLFLSDVTINVAASPPTQEEVDRNTTLITVGSQVTTVRLSVRRRFSTRLRSSSMTTLLCSLAMLRQSRTVIAVLFRSR